VSHFLGTSGIKPLELDENFTKIPVFPAPISATKIGVFASGGPLMENKRAPISLSIAPETSDHFVDRLLTPARFFKRPADVLANRTLDVREKRAILSSWASDACAVDSVPALRKPPGAESPVSFDEIMDALVSLDRPGLATDSGQGNYESAPRLDA
jgi:hypothetical protein